MKIGNFEIKGYAALAPMAGVADRAFRELCIEFGAAYVVSEMVSSKGLTMHDRKSDSLMQLGETEKAAAVQIFGCEPETMAEAAKKAAATGCPVIDINMGCPAPKIAGNGGGSALMKDPDLAARITEKVVSAVDVPVTVKIRAGWDADSVNAVEVAKRIEHAGASAITIHGRTRQQMYAPSVNLDIIKEVKESVSIPVIGNGDIIDGKSAKNMLDYTGCDAVMIGRGALGNPFIFKELAAKNAGESYSEPTFYERMDTVRELCALECQNKGERLAFLELRRHLPFFFKGIRGAADIRRRCCAVTCKQDVDDIIRDVTALYEQKEEG